MPVKTKQLTGAALSCCRCCDVFEETRYKRDRRHYSALAGAVFSVSLLIACQTAADAAAALVRLRMLSRVGCMDG